MSFPIAYIILAGMMFDLPVNSCVQLLLSPFYYIVSVLAIAGGYGLWEMYRWGWYLFIISNVFIGYETAIVMNQYSESHHKLLGFIFSLLAIISVAFRVSREVRVPYFFPKIRWWESNPRYRLTVPAKMLRKVSEEGMNTEILDLSMSGCFVKTRTDLKTDEPVQLQFSVFKQPVSCDGVVVWKSESTVTHPKGVGVKFSTMGRSEKRNLRLIAKRLKAIAYFYRTSRYLLNPEDFLKRFEELEAQSLSKRKKSSEKDESA
jgi:Tfp pilus assembly protein PilZ